MSQNHAESVAWYKRRYAEILAEVQAACGRVGRSPEGVRTIAVTKYIDAQGIMPLVEAGIRAFGENRWQQAKPKLELGISVPLEWHFIGHLQQNKVGVVVRHFDWIHSVDSLSLMDSISKAAIAADKSVQCLLQVNVSGESSKQGVAPTEIGRMVKHALALPGIRIRGLMTMAPQVDAVEETRPVFRTLRDLLSDVRCETGVSSLDQLSMGMSGDFPIAVEEGATLIRIGTRLVLPAPQSGTT